MEKIMTDKQIENMQLKACLDEHRMTDEDYLRQDDTSRSSNYDGYDFEELSIKDTEFPTFKLKLIGSLKYLDSKFREFEKIDMCKFITYLSTINEVREIVYNNSWGIVVKTPKHDNYPEHVVMDTIKDIIMEGLKYCNGRSNAILFWSAAPEDSVAGKLWTSLPNCVYDEFTTMADIEEDEVIDIIPKEDKKFWSQVYYPKYNYEYDGETFNAINERSIGKKFKVA